jgi:hypothetical protein
MRLWSNPLFSHRLIRSRLSQDNAAQAETNVTLGQSMAPRIPRPAMLVRNARFPISALILVD